MDALTRIVHVEELLPDICSLDCGTFNYGSGDETYIATGEIIRTIAKRLQEIGVKPEMEVFDIGHLRLALQMQRDGLIDDPPFFQFAMGVAWGVGAEPRGPMLMMRAMLPPRANWAAFALGQEQMADGGAVPAARRTHPRRAGGQFSTSLRGNLPATANSWSARCGSSRRLANGRPWLAGGARYSRPARGAAP